MNVKCPGNSSVLNRESNQNYSCDDQAIASINNRNIWRKIHNSILILFCEVSVHLYFS